VSGLDAERRRPQPRRAAPQGRPQRSKSIDLRLPSGRSLRVHPRSFCAPFPANRLGFVQAGLFGCTSISCMGFFRCKHHHTENTETQIKDLLARQSLAPLRASLTAHPAVASLSTCSAEAAPAGQPALAEVVCVPRPTRKSHRNTENIKNRLDGPHVVPSPVPLANFQFAQLRPVLWTGPPTQNPRKRKSKICSAKTALRAARKSTEFTKRGTGVDRWGENVDF